MIGAQPMPAAKPSQNPKGSRRGWFEVPLAVWAAYLIFQPLYVFPKGLPQPADALALALFVWLFARDGLAPVARHPAVRALAAFVFWVALVSGYWVLSLQISGEVGEHRIRVWYFPLFYLFNLVFFAGLIGLYRRYGIRAIQWTFWGVLTSLCAQVLGATTIGFSAYQRTTLFFENANQLGYFALLAATLVVLTGRRSNAPMWAMVVGLLAALFLNSLALSKSATIGVAMLVALLFVRRPATVMVLGISLYLALQLGWLDGLLERILWRFGGFGIDPDDSLEGRGYDRILRFPQYLLLGAGEGATERFGLQMSGELHSSIGTLLFSYGVVGLTLFGRFVVRLSRALPKFEILALVPIAAYGITHQGLRFRPFWIVLAVVAWVASAEIRHRNLTRRRARSKLTHQERVRPTAPALAGAI